MTNIIRFSINTQLKYLFSMPNRVKYKQRNVVIKKFDDVTEPHESPKFAILIINFVSNATLHMKYIKYCQEKLTIFFNE
jgi:hypothetical protein